MLHSSSPTDAQAQAEITRLLVAWGQGNPAAAEQLWPLVYAELRRLASSYLRRERGDHTLQPTALVNEAYLRLVGYPPQAENRAHFFGIAARAMRQVLTEYARKRDAEKRGGEWQFVSLTAAEQRGGATPSLEVELLALDQALTRLEAFDPGLARLVELRYFAELTIEETAQELGLSPATVKREWQTARVWLHRELQGNK